MKIGITQRVEVIKSYGERRDCLDQCWAELVEQVGYTPVALSNSIKDKKKYLDSLDLDGVILSGGNDLAFLENATNVAEERDEFEAFLIDYCASKKIPVLGVCRGMQMLCCHFGGNLTPCTGHTAIRHTAEKTSSAPYFWEKSFKINSFHNFAATKDCLPDDFLIMATTPDEVVEAIVHNEYPFMGIMWHPEREKPFTNQDIQTITFVMTGLKTT